MTETRYAQVARDLAEGIRSGRFPVGSLLPTEFELCDQYGASRHTVRSALKELQELGLVSRRKKAGTRVEAVTATSGYRKPLASVSVIRPSLVLPMSGSFGKSRMPERLGHWPRSLAARREADGFGFPACA